MLVLVSAPAVAALGSPVATTDNFQQLRLVQLLDLTTRLCCFGLTHFSVSMKNLINSLTERSLICEFFALCGASDDKLLAQPGYSHCGLSFMSDRSAIELLSRLTSSLYGFAAFAACTTDSFCQLGLTQLFQDGSRFRFNSCGILVSSHNDGTSCAWAFFNCTGDA